jgi:transcriptional regulator GlxA family with amidase domain
VDELNRHKRVSLQFGHLHDYLWENYSEPITVSRAASIVGMSKFRFMRFFKKATGMTFVSYLTDLRLSNAHRLLVETERPIAEVAADVGFADQSYFDRRFRQHYHQTPRQVREMAGLSR